MSFVCFVRQFLIAFSTGYAAAVAVAAVLVLEIYIRLQNREQATDGNRKYFMNLNRKKFFCCVLFFTYFL